jgi:hypothetical protein
MITSPSVLSWRGIKDEILVEYATGSISNQLFVSRYQLYLPDKALLQQELQRILQGEEPSNHE